MGMIWIEYGSRFLAFDSHNFDLIQIYQVAVYLLILAKNQFYQETSSIDLLL